MASSGLAPAAPAPCAAAPRAGAALQVNSHLREAEGQNLDVDIQSVPCPAEESFMW